MAQEALAIYLNQKFSISIGDVILIFNAIIFSVSAYFLGLEIAMYSIITYFCASKTINFLVYGLDEHVGIMIISNSNDSIQSQIIKMNKTSTVFKGHGGYSQKDKNILFCVVSKLELPKLKDKINELDTNAFILTYNISYTRGGMIKKRKYH